MPRPRRRYVRVNARRGFLMRMYFAAGIHMYTSLGEDVARYVEDIPLYGVERLRGILFLWGQQFNYDYYFNEDELHDYMNYFVYDARRHMVRDWRGIP
ncbi:MAG: hypothetical protein QXP58_07030 [Thermoprotei archaeon]